jgi:chloride channel protein, CIC family
LVIVRELMSPDDSARHTAELPAHYVYADGTARGAAELMATEGLATVPVVDRQTRQVCGTLTLHELLHGRTRSIERESERLRLFGYVPPEEGGHN